jgi:hypothetical protein
MREGVKGRKGKGERQRKDPRPKAEQISLSGERESDSANNGRDD